MLQNENPHVVCQSYSYHGNNNGIFMSLLELTLSQTSPGFYVSEVQAFWKHCGKKRNLLVTSNFSFSHTVFYPFEELSAIFLKCKIVVCKIFWFERV